jgi:hypothetical protein
VRTPPPKKARGRKTGARRFNGEVVDVDGAAALLGCSAKAVRARVARGLLPHRRVGGRVIFLRAELLLFFERLPGVPLDEALRNVARRTGEAP